jgi:hypothetical protein
MQAGQRDSYTDYAEVEHKTPCYCFFLTGQKFRCKIETHFSERILAVSLLTSFLHIVYEAYIHGRSEIVIFPEGIATLHFR